MPKMKSTVDQVHQEAAGAEDAAVRKLAHELDDDEGQLMLMMRLKNKRLDYSFINRPDPTASGVSDAMLLAALMRAGRSYSIRKTAKLKQKERIEALRNDTGDTITYKDSIVIDFTKESILSTRNQGDTLAVLSIVVQNLSRAVANEMQKRPPRKSN